MRVRFDAGLEQETNYKDLTVGNVYRVIGVVLDDFRLMSDEGLPYLYPASLFTVVDASEPADWVEIRGQNNERYCCAKELSGNFFERYFDGDPAARLILRKYLQKWREGID